MYATLTIEAIDYEQELLFTPEERYAQLTLWAQQVVLNCDAQMSTVVAEFFLGNYLKGDHGDTPYIGENGNWWIGTTDTGTKAAGEDGATPTIGENNHWFINGVDTGIIAEGQDGYTPQKGIDYFDGYTPIKGVDYFDGITPTIGLNKHWFIGAIDTGIVAEGKDGEDGVTPIITIGENENWYINGVDSGKPSRGANGTSAYEIYHAGGGTLSEVDFNESITDIPAHIEDATKHIDTTTAEFSGTIDETNDKLTIWDNSLLKWIRFSFTSLKTYLNGIYHKFGGSSYGAKQIIGSTDNQDFGVKTNNIERVTILKGGTVLINLTTGAGSLEVGGKSLIASVYNGILRLQTEAGANENALKMGAIAGVGANGYAWIQGSHVAVDNAGDVAINPIGGSVVVGGITPKSKLDVRGGIRCGDDTAAASADKVGTTRYREWEADGMGYSTEERCMKTGINQYTWMAIVTNSWTL